MIERKVVPFNVCLVWAALRYRNQDKYSRMMNDKLIQSINSGDMGVKQQYCDV